MSRFKALITGASGAIGSAIANELAKNGVDVALHFHKNKKCVEELAAEIKSHDNIVATIKADICNIKDIKELIGAARG